MSCSDVCIDMDVDCGPPSFSRTKMVIARKPHRCCECNERIAPGDPYEYAAGKTDETFWDAHTCAPCAEIRNAFVCGSWWYGGLYEEIEQVLFPEWEKTSPIDCLARLDTLAARDKLRALYKEWLT